jgi:endonuclease/exonuclease/phosphatase family metal-dependent hydrolase
MRVLTLNLWNVSEPLEARHSALITGLKVLLPDIICLQEVAHDRRTGRRQSELAAEAAGLANHYDNDALSILSRYPILRSANAALPEFARDEPRQVLMIETLADGRPLLVANTHFAWRLEMIAERKMQAKTLLAEIARFASAGAVKNKILCGDFNDDPDSPAVRLVLNNIEGFRDAYASCHPDDSGSTFALKNPYVHRAHPRDQRIDFIFASGDLMPQECSVVFDGSNSLDLASDHYGVCAEFAL